MYEELTLHPPGGRGRLPLPPRPHGSDETLHRRGMEDEICPYATFHLLGFREEMDPSKAMQFQTFPHQNGHGGGSGSIGGGTGTTGGLVGGNGSGSHAHSRSGSQSMPRAGNGRYSRVPHNGPSSAFSPEYDDPANCEPEEDQYGGSSSQYGQYGAPYDHYGSRGSVSRRSVGSARNLPVSGSPEPPPPPPRNHDPNNSSSFNDSKDSNEISEAECDRDQLVNRNYGVSVRANTKDGMTTEEMRKLIERNPNEAAAGHHMQNGLTPYDTVAV